MGGKQPREKWNSLRMEMILLLHETEPSGREARVNDQRTLMRESAQAGVPGACSAKK